MIQVEGLTKYYGRHAAIGNLTFSIERGQVVGFLGLNGAGKSTTLKVLGCVLLPTSGRVSIEGCDVVRDPHEIRKRIGYLPEQPPLYEEMTVGEYLTFVAQLRGVGAKETPAHVADAEEKTALRDVHGEVIAGLSHGFRQRVGVAQALVHKPALLVLDEPTAGLDPVQIVEMRSMIQRLRGSHTVLVSSHILSEISQTCDHLLIIQEGEIVARGTEQELERRLGGGSRVEVEVAGPAAKAVAAIRTVPGAGGVDIESEQDGVARLRVELASEQRPALARALVGAGVDLLRMDRAEGRLESIFLKLARETREPSKEAA